MVNLKRVSFILGVFVMLIFMVQGIDLAMAKDPDYPTKPITCYIPFGPGALADVASRPLLEAAGNHLGQKIIAVNKPGAGGALSNLTVMNAESDGYTLGICTPGNIYLAPYMQDTPYKDLSRLTLMMNFGKFILTNMVRGDAPWKTWKDFIEWARKNPRAAKIGAPGGRSQNFSAMTLYRVEVKEQIEFTIMPFTGAAGESQQNLLGGHITMDSTAISATMFPYIKEGKIRILSYLSNFKLPGYEDIPSFPELYGFECPNILGVVAPKGLPNYVLEKLDAAFAKGVKDPNFISGLNRFNLPLVYMNRDDFTKEVSRTSQEVGEMFKKLRAEEAKGKK
jgi:tripartite-type tricarboxylate transporter receptor subunit TctC